MKYHQFTRLFIDNFSGKENIILSNQLDINYLANVMRKKTHSQLLVFNKECGEFLAEIIEISNKKMVLKPLKKIRDYQEEQDINLIFAPIKQSRIDFLLEKVTELGVTKITPIQLKHSVVDKINLNKWHIYVKEAAEQCGRLSLPKIKPLETLNKFLLEWPEDQQIILCNEREKDLSLAKYLKTATQKINIMIGPEGGFSEQELLMLTAKKFITSVHLGPRILRSETAALCALSMILSYENLTQL